MPVRVCAFVCALISSLSLASSAQVTTLGDHQPSSGDKVRLRDICSGLPDFLLSLPGVEKDLQPSRNYPVLVFREYSNSPNIHDDALFWKPGKLAVDGQSFVRLNARSLTPISYTTEPILILTCKKGEATSQLPAVVNVIVTDGTKLGLENAKADSPLNIFLDSAQKLDFGVVNGDFTKKQKEILKNALLAPHGLEETFDMVKIDVATDNSLTYIYFYSVDTAAKGAVVVDTTKTTSKASVSDTQKADPNTSPAAWAIVERHKIAHFSVGGGFVGFHGQSHSYTAAATPTTVTTQTCIGTLITTQQNSPGLPPSGNPTSYAYNPCSSTIPTVTLPSGFTVTGYQSNVTAGTAVGTATYAFGTTGSPWSIDALAGLTVYPFGHDTYTQSIGRGLSARYNWTHPRNSLGVFLGTSVNTLGNFTTALSYEVYPGVQVITGNTFWSKTVLAPSIVACTNYGTSPSFSLAPNSTQDNVTATYTPASTSSTNPTPASTTITDVKTNIVTTATSGCQNGDKATLLSGTTVLTQSRYKPAFSFGMVFNTNLSKAFSGIFK